MIRFPRARDLPGQPFRVTRLDLEIELEDSAVRVRSDMAFEREVGTPSQIELDGEDIVPERAWLDGRPLDIGLLQPKPGGIIFSGVPERGILSLETHVQPNDAATLGLIRTAGSIVSHCEPEGFRRIAFAVDRPDVRVPMRCRIVGDKDRYPVMLANGRLVAEGLIDRRRKFVVWEDTRAKPTYLFAMAAGDFALRTDVTRTLSGREIAIEVYGPKELLPYCDRGVQWLKAAMAWHDRTLGLEYEADTYRVLVLRDYPGGAMEYPGLNIFGSAYFLADPLICTDEEMHFVMAHVGHEYFHEWTGNRVGVAKWADLCLKESLTVLRQQQFMSAQLGTAEARVQDIKRLERLQFKEDDGALAHAIRPADDDVSPAGLYTRTVYDKGAEILRHLESVIGAEVFKGALIAFLRAFDGQAACLGDFLELVETHAAVDLTDFEEWFRRSGPYVVRLRRLHDDTRGTCTISIEQGIGRAESLEPMQAFLTIRPVVELGGPSERSLAPGQRIEVRQRSQQFKLKTGSAKAPVVFERASTAWARVEDDLAPDERVSIAHRDADPVTRWGAARLLAKEAIFELAGQQGVSEAQAAWFGLFGAVLAEARSNVEDAGRLLALPPENYLVAQYTFPVEAIGAATDEIEARAGLVHQSELALLYQDLAKQAQEDGGFATRTLRNLCLQYLAATQGPSSLALCREQLSSARNMTDGTMALQLLVNAGGEHRERALAEAFRGWSNNPFQLDLWCRAHSSAREDAPELLRTLMEHPVFSLKHGSRARIVLDAFIQNQRGFHRPDGAGYRLVGEIIRRLLGENIALAARLTKAFDGWGRFDASRRRSMSDELISIAGWPDTPDTLRNLCLQMLKQSPL